MTSPDVRLRELLGPLRERVDDALGSRADTWSGPTALIEAMRYAVLGGGKRIRPALTLATCAAVGGEMRDAEPAACALELIHAYSLVHDDLPAMDDDELRRGQPTVHVKFGEAVAILAGDALQTEAFAMLAEPADSDDVNLRRLRCVEVLARASGRGGMVGGQVRDIEEPEAETAALLRMHAEKTGALFVAATTMGAIMAGADTATESALATFGARVGEAFQLSDDLIDFAELDEAGRRSHEESVNLAVLAGPARVAEMTAAAVAAAREIASKTPGEAGLLIALADWIDHRARTTLSRIDGSDPA